MSLNMGVLLTFSDVLVFVNGCLASKGCIVTLAAAGAVTLAFGREDVGVVGQAVQQRSSQLLITEDLHPLRERQVRRHQRGMSLVAVGQQVEEQLAAVALERYESEFVNDEQRHFL